MFNPLVLLFSGIFILGIAIMYDEVFVDVPRSCIKAVAKSKNFSLTKRYNSLIDKLSICIIPYINLSQDRQIEYSKILPALGIKYTPHQYVANLITQCFFYLGIGILFYGITPLLTLMFFAFSIYVYYADVHKIRVDYQKRVNEIELELPKFCSVINSRIKSTSNTMQILESFQAIAGQAMKDELVTTINDMKTGNPETALRRFEQRLNSAKVSAVVRGLISIQNGDDQSVYFQAKQHQFNSDYFTIRKKEISKRPSKLQLPILIAFIFYMLIIIYPLSEALSVQSIF